MRVTKSWILLYASAFALNACSAPNRLALPVSVSNAAPSSEIMTVPVQGRQLRISVFRPTSAPLGVLFLSHGAGGSPDMMHPLVDRLLSEGFVVIAPLHRDSMSYKPHERDDLQTAFGTRIADLQATSGLAQTMFPGLPLGCVGYSYGSLTALIGGGALREMVGARVPAIKAVASFSSPGLIPGVVTDAGLESVVVPTLMITGTKDVVPGFIPDAAQHTHYFEAQPAGNRYLAVVDEGSHDFVYGREPGYDAASEITVNFLKAYVLGDSAALQELDGTTSTGPIAFRRR